MKVFHPYQNFKSVLHLLLYCRYGCSQNRKVTAFCSLFLTWLTPSNSLVKELSGSLERVWDSKHVGT